MQPGPEDPYNQQPPTPPGYQPPGGSYPPGAYPPPGSYPPPGNAQNNTLGLLSMIFGIIGIPLACCGWGGLIFGVAATVLGYLGRQKADQGAATNRGQAQAGFILGIIGAALGVVIIILSFASQSFDWTHYYNNR